MEWSKLLKKVLTYDEIAVLDRVFTADQYREFVLLIERDHSAEGVRRAFERTKSANENDWRVSNGRT